MITDTPKDTASKPIRRQTIRFDQATYQLVEQFAKDSHISVNAAVLACVRAGLNAHELSIAPIVASVVHQATFNILSGYMNRLSKLLVNVSLQAGTARYLSQTACLQHTAMLLAQHEPDELLHRLQLYDTPAGHAAMEIHDTFITQAEQLALDDLKRPLRNYLEFFEKHAEE